jgi:hypothetical protein
MIAVSTVESPLSGGTSASTATAVAVIAPMP